MPAYRHPPKPYDEATSQFICEQIQAGAFEDPATRRYVHVLLWIEHDAIDYEPTNGLSAFAHDVCRYRYAALFPAAYDRVRSDLGCSTRADITWDRTSTASGRDLAEALDRHETEWARVQQGAAPDRSAQQSLCEFDRRKPFARFRFPVLPYDSIPAPFIRRQIRLGSFEDRVHRRYVNKLVWVWWYEQQGCKAHYPGRLGPAVRLWKLAAEQPASVDTVRQEAGADGFSTLAVTPGAKPVADASTRRQLERAWHQAAGC